MAYNMLCNDQLKALVEIHGFVILPEALDIQLIDNAKRRLISLVTCRSGANDHDVIDYAHRHIGSDYQDFCSNRLNLRAMGIPGFDLMFSDACLDIGRLILGTEVYLDSVQHVRAKMPTAVIETVSGGADPDVVPWHQDSYVHDAHPADLDMLTFWIPLCSVDVDNGTLCVVPRSHLSGPSNGDDHLPADSEILNILANPGDLVVFHKHLLHGSGRNDSKKVRYSLDFRIQTSSATSGRPGIPSVPFTAPGCKRSSFLRRWIRQQDLVRSSTRTVWMRCHG